MKKLLALVLALVMTLSLATVSTNAAFEDEKISDDYAEAVAVLNGMGVFQGDDNGKFNPTKSITRAEVATIMYRIATADTAKHGSNKAGLYASYNKFSDGNHWAAGYIGYCANAELVKGYPDGTFKPEGSVTGYEVLAMILRAVGYDKNGEFSGKDWALNVAKVAEQLDMLKNVAKTTDLGAAATRELVAELLFQGIQANIVTYTPAFGYVTDKALKLEQSTIAYENFKLWSDDSNDIWGRPTTVWFKDADKDLAWDSNESVYVELTADALVAYNEPAKNCDIYDESGLKKGTKLDVWTNGVEVENDYTVADNSTVYTKSAQGRQVEVYADRLVIIDTYLAYVDGVVTEKVDAKGHVVRDDYMKLDVYTGVNAESITVPGNDYEEGTYVLVNVNENNDNKVSIVGVNGKEKYVEILGEAESFVGAQSYIWTNTSKHTVEGTDYDDACRFYLDAAQNTKSTKFTWLLDQFGNLIGAVKIDATTNYAVLKDIIWEVGRPGHAEATIVFMDGSEDTVTVNTIDAFTGTTTNEVTTWAWGVGNLEPELEDTYSQVGFAANAANVSSDSRYNGVYEGVALYKVTYNADGTVDLDSDGVVYDANTNIDTGSSAILDNNNNNVRLIVNDNTQFLVREKDEKGNYVYNSYDRNTLPQYADDSAEIFYTIGSNGFVNRVYVKNAADESDFGEYVFAAISAYRRIAGTNTYEMEVLVDGVERWIATSYDVVETLAANTYKLFEAAWDYDYTGTYYGYISEVRLINEYTDNNRANYVTSYSCAGNTIATDTIAYTVTSDTKVVGLVDSVTNIDFDEHGVWVVLADSNARYAIAGTIYVGAKLNDDVAMTVTAKAAAGSVEYTDKGEKVFTFTSKEDVTSADLTLTSTGINSVIEFDSKVSSPVANKLVVSVASGEDSIVKYDVVVVAEDGLTYENYTIALVWTKAEVYNWVAMGANANAAVSDENPAVGYYESTKLLVKFNDNVKLSDVTGATFSVTRNVTNSEGVVTTETWTDTTAVINSLLNAGWTITATNSGTTFTVVK